MTTPQERLTLLDAGCAALARLEATLGDDEPEMVDRALAARFAPRSAA